MSPFSERDFKRFGIEEINNLNFQVLVLDCTPFLDEKFEEYICAENICIKNKNVKRCYSFFLFIKYFYKFLPNWTVYFIPLKGRGKYLQRFLIRLIVKLNSRIIHHRTGAHPYFDTLPNSKSNILKISKKIKFLLGKIIYFPIEILRADKVVIGGHSEFIKLRDKKNAILAHNLDYDNFLEISRNCKSKENISKNLLFLDEDFPYHPDFFRLGISPELDIKYFTEMSECLNKLGEILNLKTFIKLHPRANIEKSSKLYNIDIAYEDTAKLVANSDLVIAHCSTSIQLAVLFYKPIILLIPDKLPENSIYKLNINYFRNELGVPCIRTNEIKKIKEIPLVNFEKYDKYKEKFIKIKGSEEKYSWEIIINDISS